MALHQSRYAGTCCACCGLFAARVSSSRIRIPKSNTQLSKKLPMSDWNRSQVYDQPPFTNLGSSAPNNLSDQSSFANYQLWQPQPTYNSENQYVQPAQPTYNQPTYNYDNQFVQPAAVFPVPSDSYPPQFGNMAQYNQNPIPLPTSSPSQPGQENAQATHVQPTQQIAPVFYNPQPDAPNGVAGAGVPAPAFDRSAPIVPNILDTSASSTAAAAGTVPAAKTDSFLPPPPGEKKGEEKTEEKKEEPMVTFGEMFSFADKQDWLLIFVGLVMASVNGVSLPLFSLIFGELINLFGFGIETTRDDLAKKVLHVALWFVYVAIGTFVCSYGEVAM